MSNKVFSNCEFKLFFLSLSSWDFCCEFFFFLVSLGSLITDILKSSSLRIDLNYIVNNKYNLYKLLPEEN